MKAKYHSGDTDIAKESTRNEKEQVKTLRLACKNTIHFSLSILMEDRMRMTFCAIARLMGPVRACHGHALSKTRSADEALTWYKEQASGKVFEPLLNIVRMLMSSGFVEDIGLWDCSQAVAMSVDGYAVQGDLDVARKAFNYAMNLVARRMRTCWRHCRGFPGSLAVLLNVETAQDKLTESSRAGERAEGREG